MRWPRRPHGTKHCGSESAALARAKPGVRAVTEAPSPGAARGLLAVLLAFLMALLVWATFARIEVVAFAQGETVVSSRVQPVASMERATVAAVLVRNGDRVRAGQPTIRLASQAAEARVNSLRARLQSARGAHARVRALLASGREAPPELDATVALPAPTLRMARHRAQAQWQAHRAELEELEQALTNARADHATALARMQATERLLPFLERRAERQHQLHRRGIEPVNRVEEAESLLAEHRGKLEVQRREARSAAGRMALSARRREAVVNAYSAELLAEQARLTDRIAELRQELAEAEERLDQRTLRAPMAGVVQDLAVTGPGRVVEPAEVLLNVVPADHPIEVAARILDRDIALARAGQAVDVKLSAFDYTRYGSIPGVIEKIAPRATQDGQGGRYYEATVTLERAWVEIDQERIPIRPGLGATVDVQLGSRRVIEYFLAPVLRYREQALREQ
ncbi:HlyD family type I secretion periplasmic adaptor subunit [Sediminicurvatus halobius]|uniref:Membrane fusion protein (MFP) family protein n=1 Tax=Sediminicurvatus halobius TaxID=2182432 RepID=A0A2U2N2E9_9GAMM|nr:HlyD family type I secretion periplasmic adaptor subunit [Spiribacter halobius]PWG63405.1 hypothetical protein DEM34_08845 [Spiribacter halobius]UEX78075.1 HlyD family type I secretion periplasmic adaptor subunit [Spiribacter halobius]